MKLTGLACVTLVTLLVSLAPLAAQEKQDQSSAKLRATIKTAFSDNNWVKVSAVASRLVKTHSDDSLACYQLGYALHAQENYDVALEAHITASKFASNPRIQQPAAYNAACVYAIQDTKDLAFKWLEKAVAIGFNQVGILKSDADMDNLRDDARFARLLARVSKTSVPTPMKAFASTTRRRSSRAAYFGRGAWRRRGRDRPRCRALQAELPRHPEQQEVHRSSLAARAQLLDQSRQQ